MSPEELELARSLLASVQNTTVQGWDIMVRGMMISRSIDLIAGIISMAVSIYMGISFWKKSIKEHPHDGVELAAMTVGGALALIILTFIVIDLIIGDALFSVICPEYAVLEKLIGGFQ